MQPGKTRHDEVLGFAFQREFSGGIDIGTGNLESDLARRLEGATPFVLADEDVWSGPVGDAVTKAASGLSDHQVLRVRAGESAKTHETWRATLEWMHAAGVRRRDVLVIVGGGSLSDMGGFSAASYMRGIPYINVPTTLLGQADAAVGGKVAINLPGAKNAVGAFHHPRAVVADAAVLATLSRRDLAAGLAECVKVAAAQPSGDLFRFLSSHAADLLRHDIPALEHVVRAAVTEKLRLVAPDPFEEDLARVLNFGHTVGHALETADGYLNWRHGEAVAVGMATACRVARSLHLTDTDVTSVFHDLLSLLGLPLAVPGRLVPGVLSALDGIRTIRDGRLNYVVPLAVGQLTVVDEVASDVLAAAMSLGDDG
ncbi:3-dehydroquinate synthase [Actinacidiphila rubida]|uniref:2-deoxy-scyllo-inosose synthase n=1 Tax=Actinacidiphila rubida TaxID=310780 RepID=A0A1H8ELN0_9ACTN|nr:3-dehydroquinate synthase family protein [Actinacidiphila rubida]SEN20383.1 3-dehydroquinate synthase [Actinacidiphila rubida]